MTPLPTRLKDFLQLLAIRFAQSSQGEWRQLLLIISHQKSRQGSSSDRYSYEYPKTRHFFAILLTSPVRHTPSKSIPFGIHKGGMPYKRVDCTLLSIPACRVGQMVIDVGKRRNWHFSWQQHLLYQTTTADWSVSDCSTVSYGTNNHWQYYVRNIKIPRWPGRMLSATTSPVCLFSFSNPPPMPS